MKSYTATYEPQTVNGEQGYWYRCFAGGRLIFEGWSRGKKREAEAEVRNGINARDALIACTEAA
jgi:hypothetical protein